MVQLFHWWTLRVFFYKKSIHFHPLLIFCQNVSTNPQSYKFKYFYSSRNLTIVWPLVIIDPNVASLSHGPFASSPPFVFIGNSTLSFIDPNLEHNENVVNWLDNLASLKKVCLTSNQDQRPRNKTMCKLESFKNLELQNSLGLSCV
jgi:hypothetical protein